MKSYICPFFGNAPYLIYVLKKSENQHYLNLIQNYNAEQRTH